MYIDERATRSRQFSESIQVIQRDIEELTHIMRMLTKGKTRYDIRPSVEGEEWKAKCVHGNSIMTECVQCTEQNKGK